MRELPFHALGRIEVERVLGFPRFHAKRLAPQRPHRPLAVGAHRAALAAPEAPRPPSVPQGHDLDGEGVIASPRPRSTPRLRSIPHLRSIFGPHRVPPFGRVASSRRTVAGRRRGLSPGDGVGAYRSNVEHMGASPESATFECLLDELLRTPYTRSSGNYPSTTLVNKGTRKGSSLLSARPLRRRFSVTGAGP